MTLIPYPFIGDQVELSDKRERHIAETHPELLPGHIDEIRGTLLDPDQVRRSRASPIRALFSKWYEKSLSGKHVVVVVVSDAEPRRRHWVVTAYLTRKILEGDVEWKRN
jgi:hypothetical protein